MRSWKVQSNSFGADHSIEGVDLRDAIRKGLSGLVFVSTGTRHFIVGRASAEWRLDVLGGRGGVELVVDWREVGPDGREFESRPVVLWIEAPRHDMPQPLEMLGERV
jgi:hypothetical protein